MVRATLTSLVRYLIWRIGPSSSEVFRQIRSGDAVIKFISYGRGPAVLLLHGGLSNRLIWFSQIPWLVASGRWVIVLSTRGHGGSGLGKKDLNYRLLAADAVKILDVLHISQADVLGWSDGGNTALQMARRWPDRVRRIVAVSSNFKPSGLTLKAIREPDGPSLGARYWVKRWWTGAGARLAELESRIRKMWRHSPGLKEADLETITCPIFLIVGQRDLVRVSHAHLMHRLLPNSRLKILPGGHFTMITHSDRLNPLIADFLLEAGTRQPSCRAEQTGSVSSLPEDHRRC